MKQKELNLSQEISMELPEFHKMILKAKEGKIENVLMHQDAFAADYQDEEFVLLGKAIKFAGLHGINIIMHGVNRSSLVNG